jgi:hypothetical protein
MRGNPSETANVSGACSRTATESRAVGTSGEKAEVPDGSVDTLDDVLDGVPV